MTAALDRAVANALGLKSVNNCEKWGGEEPLKTAIVDPQPPQPAQKCPNIKNCGGACFQCEYFNAEKGEIEYPVVQPAQEPTNYLHAVLNAFGPDAGISLDQNGWRKLHAAIKAALVQPAQEPDWKEQYEHQKRRAEMWIAKYEKDIGPLEKAQPAQEPEMLTIAYQSGYHDGKQAALAGREWNFCERCGKRTADKTLIHTCTPPQ